MRFLSTLMSLAVAAAASHNTSLWSWTGDDVPRPRLQDGPYTPSACGNGGGGGPPYAYACPHHAMLSDDMLAAAAFDKLEGEYRYAVAGSDSDALCGACFQVQLLDAERVWRPDFPLLIVQIVNSGFDVMQGQFDLFVGAGGMGYFTALNADCGSKYCGGGPCRESMYEGSFADWTYSPFPDPNPCYGGGLRLLNETSEAEVRERCLALSGNGTSEYKDKVLYDTCVRANLELYHQNFVSSRYLRVQCPRGLYMLTGLRRDDDARFPLPHPGLAFTNECHGSREAGHFCVTSMADGCVPSCAWPGKVTTDPEWRRVDRCGRDGRVLEVA